MIYASALKETILSNQDFVLNQVPRIFPRENIVLPRELNKVIVFHGVRRSGKTFLLFDLFRKHAGQSRTWTSKTIVWKVSNWKISI